MVSISHQMVALLSAMCVVAIYPVTLGPVVGILAVIAVMVGALTPDLDHPTAMMGRKLLGARLVHNVFEVFSGGHRHLTHSFLGIAGIGWGVFWLGTHLINPAYHAQAYYVWLAFMIGYISHPIADTVTDMGVPWLWPLRWQWKFPPGPKAIRITTGSWVELLIVRGILIIIAGLILRQNFTVLLNVFK